MNMISTGSFLTETGASNKQSELVKKLTAAWEKKNSKTARAGGASLMALSLAACGGEDNTPFSQADVDAAKAEGVASVDITSDNTDVMLAQADYDAAIETAKTSNDSDIAAAAKTEALTSADGTVYATVDAAYTAGSNVTNAAAVEAALTDASGVKHNNVDVAITSNDASVEASATAAAEATLVSGSGFSSVADLLAAYTAAVAPSSAASITLTSSSDRMVEQFTGVDDTVTGAFGTVNAGDIIIDSYTNDADVANLVIDTAIAATIANIETINIDARDNANADQFVVDALNMSGYNRMSVDSNYSEVNFLVNDLESGSTLAIDSTTTSLTFNMNRTGSSESHTTSATVEIGSGVTTNFDKGTTDDVDALTIHSVGSTASVLTLDETEDYLSTTASPDSLTITGTNSITLAMSQEVDGQGFDGASITNSLSGDATLTIRLQDDDGNGNTALEGGQIDLDSVNADIIELDTITQDSTDLKVASGATVQTKAADDIRGDIKITSATAGGVLNLNLKAAEVNTSTDTIEFVSAGTVNIANTGTAAITYAGTDITTSYAGIGNKTDLNIDSGEGLTITADIAAETGSTLNAVTITGKDFTMSASEAITAASIDASGEDIALDATTTSAGVVVNATKTVTLQEVEAASDNASSLTVTAADAVALEDNIGASGTEIGNVSVTGKSIATTATNGTINGNGTVDLTSTTTTVGIGDSADVTSVGNITVTAGTSSSIDGTLTSSSGTVTVSSGTSTTSLDNGGISASGNASITSGTSTTITAGGTVASSAGSVSIVSGTTNTVGAAVTGAVDTTIEAGTYSDINAAVTATAGTLTLKGSGTTDTTFQALTGATIRFEGDGHEFTADNGNNDITGNVVVVGNAKLDASANTGILVTGTVTHSGSGTVKIADISGNYIGGDASGAVTIADTATGAASIVTGSGDDSITLGDVETSVVSGAGNDTIDASGVTTTTNMVNINAGDGVDTITGGRATDDILTGGSGTDTFTYTENLHGSASERITDFTVGSAGDILRLDASGMDNQDDANATNGAEGYVLDSDGTAIVLVDTTDTSATTHTAANIYVLSGTTYADADAAIAGMNGTSGANRGSDGQANLVVYADTDGHSYVVLAQSDDTDDDWADESTDLSAVLVRLDGLGVDDIVNLTTDNFVIF